MTGWLATVSSNGLLTRLCSGRRTVTCMVNSDKTEELLVDHSRKPSSVPNITIQGKRHHTRPQHQVTGRPHHSDLTWGEHVDVVHSKAAQRLYFPTRDLLRRAGMPTQSMLRVFTAVMRPPTEYACSAWHTTLTEQQSDKLENIQQRALKSIFLELSYREALAASGLPTPCDRRESLCRQFFQAMLRLGPRLHRAPSAREAAHELPPEK